MAERAGSTRRVFFALWPDEAQREELEHAAAKAVRRSGGRPVPSANLHVTLAFLGSVPVTRVIELQAIGSTLAQPLAIHAPISLTFRRLAHWKDAQILCALAPEPAGASALAVALQEASSAIGFSPDRRPFQAHVTLARKVLRQGPLLPLRALTWRFDAFALIDSRTEPSGPVYSVIDTYPLVADKSA
ncbi:MAG: RNA 2',3'-cyclic phosphodiesterase [Gammaproteobacteria bacterium]|nr:RNA 2',3'-cyclic phosphodiesterase [Gammaproteobacteria bacterium]MBV8974933.1 RNA 2',3'-cyclic phosphodiesterase [Nevskiaceae bacterium]